MRKLILFLLVFVSAKVSAQVYQEMPQYGYRANRMAFDSTLQIPTVCGVPTLKSIVKANKSGAIAYDSCNAKFYTYNPKTQIWSEVSGGGAATDTTSLSNRINLKLNIADTSAMLNPYLRKIDTTNKFVNSITRTEGKDSIIYFVGANRFAIKDSIGGAGSDTAKVIIAQVHNATATTLLKGEVVYLFGSNGNVASVKRANNKQDSTSSKTFGIVRRDIVSGGTGFVTTQGQIEKLNLGSYVEGDVLWLDSLDGQFTKVKPQAPYHGVFLGVVERANAGNGLAYIKPQNGVELDEVHDVQINSILNNQILVYSDTQSVWKNRNINSLIDTTLFQRKSISAYSIMANKTPATANVTAQSFRDTSGVFDGSITWTATTAPSGATNHSYRLTQIGKCVTLNISLVYATNGNATSAILLTLPSNAPAPAQPTGLTGASQYIYVLYCQLATSANLMATTAATRGMMRNNAANNGVELFASWVGSSIAQVNLTIQYWTN